MKNTIALIILVLIIASGCKYFEKKRLFSKSADTLINYAEDISDTGSADTTDFYSGMNEMITQPAVTAPEDEYQSTVSGNKRAYMVVGCFLVPQNADRYAQKMREMGYSAEIVMGHDGFHMVTVNSYNNVKSGVSEIPKYRSEINQNAWVFVKR